MQTASPAREVVPFWHTVQTVAPVAEAYVPAVQEEQLADVVAPNTDEYVPVAHAEQIDACDAEE